MPYSDTTRRSSRFRKLTETRFSRVRELADAGADGRPLTPHEVKEICEALRARVQTARTNFHSGV